jgi:hypothetical protein
LPKVSGSACDEEISSNTTPLLDVYELGIRYPEFHTGFVDEHLSAEPMSINEFFPIADAKADICPLIG